MKEERNCESIILGTRETDPYAQSWSVIKDTDTHKGWPLYSRVMLIYYWSYKMVWRFIKECELPYCKLYDKGFTYVGDQSNSIPNPFLASENLPSWFGNDNIGIIFNQRIILKNFNI